MSKHHASTHRSGVHGDTVVFGWREWVALPDLSIRRLRAKLDTGARTSSLHVAAYQTFMRDGVEWVRFTVDPNPRRPQFTVNAEAPVIDKRKVRSSTGEEQLRITIRTTLRIADREWPVDVTLSSRDAMRYRMLVGRQGLQGRAVVDPGTSYRAGKPRRVIVESDEEEA